MKILNFFKFQNKIGKRGTLLSSIEQGKISSFFEENLSTAEIARRLNRSHNTVKHFYKEI